MRDAVLVIGGLLVVLLAGYGASAYLRRRRRLGDLKTESAAARRAIRLAEISRDAQDQQVLAADQLLTRAEALMSKVPNAATARKAAGLARRADRKWRAHNDAVRDRSQPGTHSGRAAGSGSTASVSGMSFHREDLIKVACVVGVVLIGLIFVSQQVQQPDVTFKPREAASTSDAGADGSDYVDLPSYSQITAQYGDEPIVTLPGATAWVDSAVVLPWMDKADVRQIVIAPPIGPKQDNSIDVPDDVMLVIGTDVSLSPYGVQGGSADEMARVFAFGDVTDTALTLLATRADETEPDSVAPAWRPPTSDELAPVLSALEQDGIAFVDGAESFATPPQATEAYPEGVDPLIVVAPLVAPGEAGVDYATAVAEAFPDRPVVAMTGLWIEFAGPYADEFAVPLTANFYGQFGQRLQEHLYPQESVLRLALDRVAQFRFSGIFDKPLPFEAPDPLRLTLPLLPWICAGLGLIAAGAAIAQIYRHRPPPVRAAGANSLARLAGLSELAVEVSGLTDNKSQGALGRAFGALNEANGVAEGPNEDAEALDELLDRAERELRTVATKIDRHEYEPDTFLNGRWT